MPHDFYTKFVCDWEEALIIAAISTWVVFCIRDYCLLQNGLDDQFRRRSKYYLITTFGTTGLICLALLIAGPNRVSAALHSPWILGPAIAIHILVMTMAYWFHRTNAHESSWLICLIPAPTPWILLAITATAVIARHQVTMGTLILALPLAWVCLLFFQGRMRNNALLSLDAIGFSVPFAGWANSMACCLIPLIVQ